MAEESGSPSVDAAVRDLVHAEVVRLGLVARPQKTRATHRDVFWTAFALLNVGLLVWTLYPRWLADPRFKVVSDVVPWVASTFFAVSAAWFRETLINLVGTMSFRRCNVLVFPVLAALQFPLVPLRGHFQPQEAAYLTIEGRPVAAGEWLRVGGYKAQVVSKVTAYQSGQPFEMSMLDLLSQAWNPENVDYRWRLTAPFSIEVDDQDAGAVIRVESATPFTGGFTAADNVKEMLTASVTPTVLEFRLNAERYETEVTGNLPVGRYDVTVSRAGCTPVTRTITVPAPSTPMPWAKLRCGS